MPPPPEFPEGLRKIRRVKIFAQTDAQHSGNPQHKIDTAGEIRVKLNGVQEHRSQCVGAAELFRIAGNGGDNHPRSGGNDQLFEQAPKEPGSAA